MAGASGSDPGHHHQHPCMTACLGLCVFAWQGRCPSLPQPTQRPANPAYHTFVQYNIDEGGKARQDRLLVRC